MPSAKLIPILGSPRAIGMTTFLVSIPIGFVATFTASRAPFASFDVFLGWFLVGLISHSALGVILFLGNRVIRIGFGTGRPSRISIVVVTIVAAATRGAVIAGLCAMWELSTTTSGILRILSSAVIMTAWLTIIGAVLAASDRYRAEISRLIDDLVNRELQSGLRDESGSSVYSADAVKRVAESAGPLGSLLREGKIATGYSETAALIVAVIDERLRPLSHELWFTPTPIFRQPRSLFSFVGRVWRTPVPYKRALPLMAGFVLFNTLVRHGGPIGLIQGTVTAVLAAAIVLPLTVWGGAHRLLANSLMYGGVAVVPALGGVIAVESLFGGDIFQSIIGVTVIMGSAMMLGFWLGAAAQTVVGDRASTLAELRALSRDPAWDVHIRELHRRTAEASVATFLHGTIQSRLTAAALQLQTAAKTNDLVRAEAAVDLAVATVALASQPAGHVLPASPVDRLTAFALAWTGIAEISLDLPRSVDATAGPAGPIGQERMIAWALVADAVEECVTNAIRHGKATAVRVSCRDLGDVLEATISDDGAWDENTAIAASGQVDEEQPMGIGLTLIDRISQGNWSAVKSEEGTTLLLRVQI